VSNVSYEAKLAKAKATLILDHPFFASLLLSMPMIIDESVKTMATNGDEVRINPQFVDKLTLPETVFVLAHETMHCVFQHMHRRGDRQHNRWNQAADYIINDTIVNERIGSMPQGCLHNSKLVQQGDGTTEGVYKLLPEVNEGKSPGDKGGALDDVNDAAQDQATMSQKESEMRVKIVQASNAAKMQGKLSGGMERIVKQFTKSHVDWRAVLRRFLSERAKVEYSYARPKRRFLADDINLPSLSGEKLGSVVVAVDCSGSINEEVLGKFSVEVNAICQDVHPSMIHVVYFDSEVLKQDTYIGDEEIKLKPVGGGGTAFSPVFKHIEDQDLNPIAIVFLTDLECDDFGPAPYAPVLWASTHEGTAPFGEVVLIKEK
jgi:predicted metal-dependent peptidase